MLPDERAQSEVVGTVLLVGVVIVTVTTLGAGLLGSVPADDEPLADVTGAVATDELRLTHRGGESLAVAALEVVVRADGATTRTPFADGALAGSDPDRFDPGETWTTAASFAEREEVHVYLVHEPSGEVLFEGRKLAATPTTVAPPTTTPETTTPAPTTETTTTETTTTTPPTATTVTTTPSPNDSPTAAVTVACEGLTCEFDATDSADPDGSIASYEWDFGDGASAAGPTASHAYGSRGTYAATLTVTDGDGATDAEAVTVAVEPPRPRLSGVSVTDRTENDHADYRVAYDVTNRADFGYVTVEFENRRDGWADATLRNDSARGYVEYRQGGAGGDTFDVTVRVHDESGAVTDVRTITDVADGSDADHGDDGDGDFGGESSPEFAGTVVDDVSAYQADYEVSYNVTNRTNFSHVRVRVENLDDDWASATYTSAAPRTNVDDYAEASYGDTFGDSYRIRMQVVDTAGIVVDERVVTDAADGTDPDGNDDLGRASSPDLLASSVADKSKSNQGPRFDVDYEATAGAAFDRVEVQFRNRDSRRASETLSGGASGKLSHRSDYAYGDRYVIEIRVIDSDGIVVAERVVADTADGTDP